MLTVHRPRRRRNGGEDPIGPAPWVTTNPPGPMAAWAASHDRRFIPIRRHWPHPLVPKRARGSVIEDLDGNRYLDLCAVYMSCPTGHAHPAILDAMKRQADLLEHGEEDTFITEPLMRLARTLERIAPGHDPRRVVFTRDGYDALVAAVHIAEEHTGRRRVLHCVAGGSGAGRSPVVRAMNRVVYGDLGGARAATERRRASGGAPAAMIVEPGLNAGEGVIAPEGYLQGLRQLCDEHDMLLIADETRTGLGRTGRMFACEREDVTPDILLLANRLSGGPSVHVLVVREALVARIRRLPIDVSAGDPIAAAGMIAAIEVLERGLIGNAVKLAPFARNKLERMVSQHRCLAEPRGLGLLWALDVVKPRRGSEPAGQLRDRILAEAFSRGLLLEPCGVSGILLAPALCINRVQLEVGLNVFEEAVATVSL